MMMNSERRFSRGARLVLLFALVFIALDIAQLAYRFFLPTEGWLVIDSDIPDDSSYFPLSRNLVGAPSPLHPGDGLQIIGGTPAQRLLLNTDTTVPPRPVGWYIGGQVPVTVVRNGQLLDFDIPIVGWTLAVWWKTNSGDPLGIMYWLSALILFGVGLFTFLNRPQILAARFLFLFGVTYCVLALSSSLPDVIGVNFDLLAVMRKALFSFVIFAYLLGPSLLGFALTFPHPKAFVQRHPVWLLAPFVIGSIAPLFLFINPQLAAIGFPITLGMVLAAIMSLIQCPDDA